MAQRFLPDSLSHQHTPFVGKVRLVPDQHDDDVASSLRPDVVDPFGGLLEGVDVWQDRNKYVSQVQDEYVELKKTQGGHIGMNRRKGKEKKERLF